mgnify:CR=1 FL=1
MLTEMKMKMKNKTTKIITSITRMIDKDTKFIFTEIDFKLSDISILEDKRYELINQTILSLINDDYITTETMKVNLKSDNVVLHSFVTTKRDFKNEHNDRTDYDIEDDSWREHKNKRRTGLINLSKVKDIEKTLLEDLNETTR